MHSCWRATPENNRVRNRVRDWQVGSLSPSKEKYSYFNHRSSKQTKDIHPIIVTVIGRKIRAKTLSKNKAIPSAQTDCPNTVGHLVFPAAYLVEPSSTKRPLASSSTTDPFSVATVSWPVHDKSTIVDLEVDGKQQECGSTRASLSKQLWSKHSLSKLSLPKPSSSNESSHNNLLVEHWLSNGLERQQDWPTVTHRVLQ
mmetsp:Transcript_28003/g.58395  ORF Transcript_28003/g.58395 Transcript_28003/m.58395 type:complete len:199 (+) Transcript_28003:450-1046(+)